MNNTTTKSPERIQFLTDVLITAVEGGIGYWSQVSDYNFSAEDPAERGVLVYIPKEEVDRADYRIDPVTDSIQSWGETIEAFRVRVTLDDLARGLGVITRGETSVHSDYVGAIFAASVANDAGDLDSYDADMIFQAAIFGDVIYG